jgi:sec-independent protein translocase protein TatB
MLELSLSEILVIVVVALLVLKPEDVPGAMKSFGKFVGKAKRFTRQFTDILSDDPNSTTAKKVLGDDGKYHEAFEPIDIDSLTQNTKKNPAKTNAKSSKHQKLQP